MRTTVLIDVDSGVEWFVNIEQVVRWRSDATSKSSGSRVYLSDGSVVHVAWDVHEVQEHLDVA